MSDYDLIAVDCHYPFTEFTYEYLDGSAKSRIDHILSSCLFAQLIYSIVKLDLAHNLSDHHVLSSNLDYPQVLHIWLVSILQFNPLLVLHGTCTKSLNSISFAFATF